MYDTSARQAPVNEIQSSLLGDTASVNDRLELIYERVLKLGNVLHGARPRDAGAKANAPDPEPTLRRNVDKALNLLSMISIEFDRIEDPL